MIKEGDGITSKNLLDDEAAMERAMRDLMLKGRGGWVEEEQVVVKAKYWNVFKNIKP